MAERKTEPYWWNRSEMRDFSRAISEKEGLMNREEQDSFRHAYASAKVADAFDGARVEASPNKLKSLVEKMFSFSLGKDLNEGKTISRMLGGINEFGLGTSFEDHVTDIGNNEIGLMIRDEVERDVQRMKQEWNLSDEQAEVWRERLLRTRIAEAVKEGKMTQKPFSGPQRK